MSVVFGLSLLCFSDSSSLFSGTSTVTRSTCVQTPSSPRCTPPKNTSFLTWPALASTSWRPAWARETPASCSLRAACSRSPTSRSAAGRWSTRRPSSRSAPRASATSTLRLWRASCGARRSTPRRWWCWRRRWAGRRPSVSDRNSSPASKTNGSF